MTDVWPRRTLAAVAVLFALASAHVAVLTPPWEANDEPDHARNVQTLVAGHWYRMQPGAGLEAHQAPLYYFALAGWQRVLGVPPRNPQPQPRLRPLEPCYMLGVFQHNVPSDGADQRLNAFLRLPSVVLGVLTLLLTAAAARRLSADAWTPVVAAAVVAGVPIFVFLSGQVNNDNLSITLGAALTLLAVIALARAPIARRQAVQLAAGLGALFGALVLTKISTVTVGVGVLLIVWRIARDRRERFVLAGVAGLAAFIVCGWWLAQNQVRYGDPLAAVETHRYLESIAPLFHVDPPLKQALVQVPYIIYGSFWYRSGWSQFKWKWFMYVPLWLLLAVPLVVLAIRGPKTRPPAGSLAALTVIALAANAALWLVGIQSNAVSARIAFVGLPAIACLVALGLERLWARQALRFAGPALGALLTLVAIRRDIIDPYFWLMISSSGPTLPCP